MGIPELVYPFTFCWTLFSSEYMEANFLSNMVIIHLTLYETANCFPKYLYHFTFLTAILAPQLLPLAIVLLSLLGVGEGVFFVCF